MALFKTPPPRTILVGGTWGRCGLFRKGLYFTAVVFFFLSSTPNLWGYWTDLNQTWTHSLTTAIWKIWSELSRAFTPHGLGAKTAFWDRLWTLTDHRPIPATEHDINNWKETCQSTGTPLHATKFDELWSRLETAENGWRVFAHP